MGEVYLARQLSMDRDVALKILPSRLSADKEVATRFLNEARLLARLDHPHIVTAHEAGQDGGMLFMAMAFVKGEPLDRKLGRDGPLPERMALTLTRKIATALAYAWNEHRMLHQDIKPANILLDVNGEPKLADLGLSRRMASIPADPVSEPILGTPNYMSPEQIEGKISTDFRSDMYSLGTTLHHMLTGKLPFASEDMQETLRRQVEESLPDPRTFQLQISDKAVALLAKMLAKNPAHRHASWESLMDEIDHILGNRSPLRVRLPRGPGRPGDGSRRSLLRKKRILIPFAMLLLLAGLAVGFREKISRWIGESGRIAPQSVSVHADESHESALDRGREVVPEPTVRGSSPVADAQSEHGKDLQRRFEEATAFARGNPGRAQEARNRLVSLQAEAAGTPLEPELAAMLLSLENELAVGKKKVFQGLQQEAQSADSEPALLRMIEKLETYTGLFSDETQALRESLLGDLRAKLELQRAKNRAQQSELLWKTTCKGVAESALQFDFAQAISVVDRSLGQPDMETNLLFRLQALQNLLQRVAPWQDWILDSFRQEIGRTVSISMAGGSDVWEIREIAGDKIHVRKAVGEGFLTRTISFNDLSLVEKFRRIGSDPAPERELLRGLISYHAGRMQEALKSFSTADEILGPALAEEALLLVDRNLEAAAEKALNELLRQANIPGGEKSPMELASTIRRRRFSEPEIAAIRQTVSRYRAQYGLADLARTMDIVLVELEAVSPVAREVDLAEVQIKLTELRRANPQSAEFQCVLKQSAQGLVLNLSGNSGLITLQQLEGLPLVELDLSNTRVRDLTPLHGMPLRDLKLNGTPISNLGALEGLQIERLSLDACPVSDLSPLIQIPLEELSIASTRVSSILPLRGKKIRKLSMQDTGISTLRPLVGMPLESLSLGGCAKIDNLEPLRGAPLNRLVLTGTSVRDLTPLSGMPLENFEGAFLPALQGLKGLEKAPLRRVILRGTPVSDLRALAESPISRLDLRSTLVEDLSQCAGWPLEELDLEGSNIRDLRPLLQCLRLSVLVLPNRQADWTSLMEHPSLKRIGFSERELQPVRQFWNPRGEKKEVPR